MKNKHKVSFIALILIIGLVSGCSPKTEDDVTLPETQSKVTISNQPEPQEPEDYETTIYIQESKFQPSEIRIKQGNIVTWINDDDETHVIEALDISFASDELSKRDQFSHAFEKKGTFEYRSLIKPNMKGKVIVI